MAARTLPHRAMAGLARPGRGTASPDAAATTAVRRHEQAMKRLEGRRAVVTGAGRGLGLAVAERRARGGRGRACRPGRGLGHGGGGAALGRRWRGGRRAPRTSPRTRDVQADGRRGRAHGGLDVLGNNAGISSAGTVTEVDGSALERVLAVNLTAAYLCCRYAVPHWNVRRRRDRVHLFGLRRDRAEGSGRLQRVQARRHRPGPLHGAGPCRGGHPRQRGVPA